MDLAIAISILSFLVAVIAFIEQHTSNKQGEQYQRQVTTHLRTIAANTKQPGAKTTIPLTKKRQPHVSIVLAWSGMLMFCLVLLFTATSIQFDIKGYLIMFGIVLAVVSVTRYIYLVDAHIQKKKMKAKALARNQRLKRRP